MNISLKDYLDFVLLWLKKRTKVHLGDLVVYPALVRHCFCCHGSAKYASETNALCKTCLADQECTLCHQPFEPNADSVGTYCAACWKELETTWVTTFEDDPVKAEGAIRSAVTTAQPSLIGCRHTN